MLTVKIIGSDGSTSLTECFDVDVHPSTSDFFKEREKISVVSNMYDGVVALVCVSEATDSGSEAKEYHVYDDGSLYITDSSGNTVMTYIG